MKAFIVAVLAAVTTTAGALAGPAVSSYEAGLIQHVQDSIARAEAGESQLTADILKLDGMSSPKVRHLLNNLCTLPNTHYLEIGLWKGSTFISALYGNKSQVIEAVGIDNWSEFGAPRDACLTACSRYLPAGSYAVYSADCFNIDPQDYVSGPVDIYFFDGRHLFQDQLLAFTHYDPVLADSFIAMVDDWNWQPVKDGTFAAFNELGYEVLYQVELPSNGNGDLANWWNGLYVAVIRKGEPS